MMGRCNLLFPPAPLHPNGGAVQLAISARAAGSQFAIQRMLAHDVLAMQTLFSHLPAVIK